MRAPASGGANFTIARVTHQAKIHAAAAAASESASPSENNSRRIRERGAPNARRTAISRCRATERASTRVGDIGTNYEQRQDSYAAQHTHEQARPERSAPG